ncbi:mCG1041746 [Mus musculus]|nr:mCG1041746 [Mus musculus]
MSGNGTVKHNEGNHCLTRVRTSVPPTAPGRRPNNQKKETGSANNALYLESLCREYLLQVGAFHWLRFSHLSCHYN